MVKIKEEVWIERCDFCKENKKYTCAICGLDLCSEHALILRMEKYTRGDYCWIGYDYTTKLVEHFCPNHLSPELREAYNKKLKEIEKERKT